MGEMGESKPMKKIACFFIIFLCLCSCATDVRRSQAVPHPEFTRQKVTQIQVGMTPHMLEALFGLPDRTSTTTLGAQTSQPWSALVYEYDMWKPLTTSDLFGLTPEQIAQFQSRLAEARARSYNTFYFSLSNSPPTLAHWSVNIAY